MAFEFSHLLGVFSFFSFFIPLIFPHIYFSFVSPFLFYFYFFLANNLQNEILFTTSHIKINIYLSIDPINYWTLTRFSQVQGIYYEETFAPIARMESIRLFLAIVTPRSGRYTKWMWKMNFYMDTLMRDLYEYPNGYVKHPYLVWRLRKLLYGLK